MVRTPSRATDIPPPKRVKLAKPKELSTTISSPESVTWRLRLTGGGLAVVPLQASVQGRSQHKPPFNRASIWGQYFYLGKAHRNCCAGPHTTSVHGAMQELKNSLNICSTSFSV